MKDIVLRNMTSVYLLKDEKMLLLYRIGSRVIKDSYTGTAGGHFEKEELNDPKACVLRELVEETGLGEKDIGGLALRYVTLRLKGGEIRQNYYYFAKLESDIAVSSKEGKLQWVNLDMAPDLDMPFTAKYVVKHYLEVGRDTDLLYGGIADREGVNFFAMQEEEMI